MVVDKYVRAVKGGLGEAKASANYAASLHAAEDAKHEGFTQVLWLDGVERKYIEEVGTMNILFRIADEVITPPLAGTILAGVTRDSVLALAREWGLRASERQLSIDEVVAAARKGTLQEVWGTGTAAVISPVGELAYGRAHRRQRRPHRRARAEALRHDREHPVRRGEKTRDGWTLEV